MRRLFYALFFTMSVSFLSLAGAQVEITFDKSALTDGVWIGTVSGDVTGRLVTLLVAADQSQPTWQVDFYWVIVADDPSRSFVARLTGTLDSVTGAVSMSGTVNEGFLVGARVEEAGQLMDAATSRFTGTIRLVLATAEEFSSFR